MERAAEETKEVYQMTDNQSNRYELLARYFEIQTAIDRITDPASRTILEEQKKEITEKLKSK